LIRREPMSVEEAFLRDILDNPDDMTPRLIYADWLEEHGPEAARPRAELIRVQCELEDLPEDDPRRDALERRSGQLLRRHAKEWTAPLRALKAGTRWEFRRGFVEGVTTSATNFARVAKKLFALAPIRAARFPEASNEVHHLLKCPHFDRLSEVNLHRMCVCGTCPIDEELHQLFASPRVANLTTLVVSGDRIDEEGAKQLASSRHLANLTTLDLSGNRVGTEGVQALLAGRLKGLKNLTLKRNSLRAAAAQAIAESRRVAGLAVLDLSGNRVGDTGARALVESPHLSERVTLDVSKNGVSKECIKALRARFRERVRV
jgi:uncharacterized protein (TIGR02996 family)